MIQVSLSPVRLSVRHRSPLLHWCECRRFESLPDPHAPFTRDEYADARDCYVCACVCELRRVSAIEMQISHSCLSLTTSLSPYQEFTVDRKCADLMDAHVSHLECDINFITDHLEKKWKPYQGDLLRLIKTWNRSNSENFQLLKNEVMRWVVGKIEDGKWRQKCMEAHFCKLK